MVNLYKLVGRAVMRVLHWNGEKSSSGVEILNTCPIVYLDAMYCTFHKGTALIKPAIECFAFK